MEALYQQVWAQVFGQTWAALWTLASDDRAVECKARAEQAAAAALRAWDYAKQDTAVGEKGQS